MINNTIINRKIKHNSKNGIYGLKRKGRWMEENKTLDQFNEMKFVRYYYIIVTIRVLCHF